jgi:hypothetical protein
VWGRGQVYIGFCWRSQKKRHHLEDPGIDGMINIKMDIQEGECGSMDWIDLA